ncbi:hypothetical protein QTO30_00605 [Yoonia sp. GPGPB17]|uniref:hypothetical protein n=1 Tax=Yoonia sp. GPGPB17 TaxID=3026147 RepID=UPI0030BF9818
MDENTKVLDVTYGNFSCRLEGFDDSVETMKVVVSFFHDLAGHDRFMDTEPLAPDMQTLARLTEEQSGQPVEAEGHDNKVSLRVRTEVVEEDVADDDVAEDTSDETVAEQPIAEDFVDEADTESVADDLSSVAEKLQRMRAATARKVPPTSEDYSEDLPEAPATNPLSQRLNELVQRTTQSERDMDAAQEPAGVDEPAEDTAEADVPELDQISGDDAIDAEDMNVFSDLNADTAEDTAQGDAVMSEDLMEEPALDVAEVEDDQAETLLPEAAVAEAMLHDEAAIDQPEGDVSDAEAFLEDTELEAFLAEEEAAEAEETAQQDDATAGEDGVEPESDASDADDAEDVAQDEEAPLVLTSADKADEETSEDDHDDYNDDDEFDLEAEVAKVEAEIAARQGNEFARRGLPRHVEDAMSRIMSQTDQHLNQPENRRHRDAFAQLKAAVAATEAARQLGDKGTTKPDPDEVYKDDLGAHEAKDKSEVKGTPPLKLVKSQEVKPAGNTLSKEATLASQSAPESDSAADAPSARLRQIATMKEAEVAQEGDDFAAFIASHGATDLADKLEAAGAYICFVEGEADFSRPQVMKLVQSATSAEISREDGLRNFGRLLRQARLIKLENGRFQVSENTQYRPEGHQAAQG